MPRRLFIAIRLLALAVGLVGAAPLAAEDWSLPPYASPAATGSDASPASGGAAAKASGDAAAPASAKPTEVPAAPESAPAGGQDLTQLQKDTLLVELSTAGYYELAARARELGLADTGTAEEIRARLYVYYGLKAPAASDAKKGRTVTIERAASAGYAKVEEEDGGIVRMSGGVILSLAEANGDTHKIRADSIVYNRARSTLTARGSVRYERKSGDNTEVFTGEALSTDLNDWSGVFLDGKVRTMSGGTASAAAGGTASNTASSTASATASGTASGGKASSERGLVVEADTILRKTSNVMVLQNGVISSCDADDPHYAIRAKRVWLLGDKEWAISNAVFSLGNVPILWVPFFYYPGDELVFHPVIGYRSREGRFLQTTTYLIGAKPPKTTTTTLMSYKDTGTAKPTELKGMYLRHVSGPPPTDRGKLKVMADYYSSLGAFSGISGSFPKMGSFGTTSLYLGIGRSRSLFTESNSIYSPYDAAGNYDSVWNSSNFLGISLPIRYGLDLSTTFTSGGLTTSIALPIYSDPYFEQDFTDRTEDMDWFKMFKSTTEDATTTTISTRSQLNPKIESTYSFKPTLLNPWLSSVEVTRFTTSAILNSKTSTADSLKENSTLFNYDPNRTFFYPYLFRPVDASVTFKGTLLGNPSATPPKDAKDSKDSKSSDRPKVAAPVDEMRNPWSDPPAEEVDKAAEGDKGGEGETSEAKEVPEDFRLTARAPDLSAPKNYGWSESLGWTLTPSAYYEDSYLSENVIGPSDVNYDRLYGLYSYKLVTTLDQSAAYGDLLSSSVSLSYADQKQERPYLNDENADEVANYQLADKSYQSRLFTQSSKMTLRPLASIWLWSGSNVSWDMISTIYGYKYDSTTSAFQEKWMSWDSDSITSHDLSVVLEMRPRDLKQTLSLTAALPPVLESYAGKLAFDAGFASLYTQSRMYRKIKGADFSYDPITTGSSLGLAPWPVLTDTYVYDVEDSKPQSNVAGLAWGPASASLTSTRTQSYTPVAGSGWVAYGDETFAFSNLELDFNPQIKGDESSRGGPAWSFNPSLDLSQSLIRFTESNLDIKLNATYKMSDTLSFTLSSDSLNSSAWRYFPWVFKKDLAKIGQAPSDYQVNPLTDIWNSLRVWDKKSQTESLIKLKSLSLKASQDLHDWTLSAEVSTKPLYDATLRSYSLDTTFSILLAWKDIPDIKTTITKQTAEPITY